jgi:hypothetical protein
LAIAQGPSDTPAALPEVVCDAESATVSLTMLPGTVDRVAPGWRGRDGAVRLRWVSKGDTSSEGDRTCSKSGVKWGRVVLDLGDQSDETNQHGIDRHFRELPDSMRFVVYGGDGEFDEFAGYNSSDRLDGGAGADEIFAYGGRDRLIGGTGEDHLFAGGQRDVIEAADGERDQVVCGWGRDSAFVDRFDDYDADCETTSVVDIPPPDDGQPPSPLAPDVRRIAAKFGLAFLRFDGAAGCDLMTVEGRRAALRLVRSYLSRIGAAKLPKRCPSALKVASIFGSGEVGPDLTKADVKRARHRRLARIKRLRSGRGIFGINVSPDGATASVEEVVGVGALSAVPVESQWRISEWMP